MSSLSKLAASQSRSSINLMPNLFSEKTVCIALMVSPNLKEADVGGVAHEVGTLRMPIDRQKGVVDQDLKFEGYENLYACDNSVFPCSPAGNPSLTLEALARRCAKAVAANVSIKARL